MNTIDELICRISDKKRRIVFPEGHDIRILKAVARLNDEGIVEPVILGDVDIILKLAHDNGLDLSNIKVVDITTSDKLDDYVEAYLNIREGTESVQTARDLMRNANYFGTMMLHMGEVDGMVAGAVYTSSQTIRPALQIIKTRPGVSRVSGAMLLIGPAGQKYLYADIAVNTAPLGPHNLAQIAIDSARTAEVFGINPKVAMLSFSTKGSAVSVDSRRMAEATKIAQNMAPQLDIDGEIQFDAAINEIIGQQKAPGSKVAGQANVFIFPDIQSGNIAYKITQHLAGFQALGPLLQGLNKPVNDLSRGCSVDDIYKVAIITAAQV